MALESLINTVKATEEGAKAISAFNAGKSLGICMLTAGILSILYIYAMANFATCIAYTVIAIIELWIVVFILVGLAIASGKAEDVAVAATTTVSAM